MEGFVGRQPIFSRDVNIVAYELLYRNNNLRNSSAGDGDFATIDVIVNTILNIGIDKISDGKYCFVNLTENLILSDLVHYLNPERFVIEILEDVPITAEIVERVKMLKQLGFKIALDDFVLQENVHIYDQLFRWIDFLKVDFLLSPIEKCIDVERIVKERYPQIKLLAEKVETYEQLEIAKSAGYELFQGYFFEKPQIIRAVDVPSNMMFHFELISLLSEADPNINEIANLIEKDVSLSYKLLQIINMSTGYSVNPIQSIKQAIVRIGFIELRKMLYLLALQEKRGQVSESSMELIRTSLLRAKICEKVAKATKKVNYSECFLVGMFSLIDVLLEAQLEHVLNKLPLSVAISATLLGEETEYTKYLELSIALDKLQFEKVEVLVESLNIHSLNLEYLYKEAVEWADSAVLSSSF